MRFAIASTSVFQQVFCAYKDMRTPTVAALVVFVSDLVLCLVLSVPLGHGGIALAGSISAAINGLLLIWFLRRRLGPLDGRLMLAQIGQVTAATACMTGYVLGLKALWQAPGADERFLLALWVAAIILVAAVSYILAARLLRMRELDELLGAMRRRGKGNTKTPTDSP